MINKAFFETAKEVAEVKGISVDDVYENVKKAIETSFKKKTGCRSCEVTINPDKNEILLFSKKLVVESLTEDPEDDQMDEILLDDAKKIKASYKIGDVVIKKEDIKDFSRSFAADTKSNYTQGIKTRQRQVAYQHFKSLEDEMVLGTVGVVTDNYVTVDLGMGIVSRLSKTELLANDTFQSGDTIRVYIRKVEETNKDPKVSISRTDRQLVIRLMETYIPEIKSGIIEIKGIARDPGDRSKIALYSNDPKVDAIGSCVGEGGSRIRDIVNALGGEKVDLYKWSENPEELIPNSLQPANVTKVLEIDTKEKSSRVVVPDDQLSLAIGKSGQNVRLAVQSCGWKIDIMPTSKAFDEGYLIK